MFLRLGGGCWLHRPVSHPRILPRVQETPPKRLSDADVATLLRLRDPWGFAIRLAPWHRAEVGEMIRARAEDVGTTSLTVSQTKSGRVRRIPLSNDLREEIRTHVGLLLPFGHPSDFARKVRRLSGLKGFHAHQLRHTYASRWLEAGGSLVALQELLGHASITTTQRYARLAEAAVQMEVARVMGNTMGTIWGTSPL